MKFITLIMLFISSVTVQAQVEKINDELYVRDSWDREYKVNLVSRSESKLKKVDIGSEKEDGSIEILSDLIVHQDLKLYVVNPLNGKVSRIDLDEKSDSYGSVDVVSGLMVKHDNKFYLVNPLNGKTKRIKD